MDRAGAGLYLMLLFVFTTAAGAQAQEVQFIDLTAAPQRVEIRQPPFLPKPSNNGHGVAAGYYSASIGDCAADIRDPHSVAVYLDGVDGSLIDPSAPFQAEFRFVNTGKLPINIPVSPNRADLQPADPSTAFTYLSLALAVRATPGSIGYVELYGAVDHEGTTRVLRPGEWIRIKANVKLNSQPSCPNLALKPGFWLRTNWVHATSDGIAWRGDNLCLNVTPTPPVTAVCEQGHGEIPK